jgi:predicted metal-dependent hydrolase
MFGMGRRPPLRAGDVVAVEGATVRLAVSARARRISLRVDVSARQGVATAPSERRLADALAFARSRGLWLAERLARLPEPSPFRPGQGIEVAGAPCRLERAAMRIRPRLVPATEAEPSRLIASGEGEAYARAVERALRAEALARLSERTAVHCARLGCPLPVIRLQDAHGRWGSCRQAHAGAPAAIRYNWRLVLAPPTVLDYVAAHECAHLVEANHGPGFWAQVAGLYGDPRAARRWLRDHGGSLHAAGRSASSSPA